jgi:L-threonylcarbamoyladenylate synthase
VRVSSASRNEPAHPNSKGDVKTLRIAADPARLASPESQNAIARAAEVLRAGGTVALPTETVYGLAANALDRAAVEKIFIAKERPSWDPVIVHVADESMVEGLVTAVPDAARALMAAFWPGPLTLLLPRSPAVPDIVTAGRPLVGVRMPAHGAALEVIRQAGVPLAAPSANRFGHVSPTTAAHVLEDLDGRIDAVLDAGPTARGLESTVIDPNESPMIIYRPGAVALEAIRAVVGAVEHFRGESLSSAQPEALPSPGVGIRHYAPRARLVLVDAPCDAPGERLAAQAREVRGERTGVMLPAEIEAPDLPAGAIVRRWGRWQAPEEMAHDLYAVLRELDARGCDVIVCPLPPAEGLGAAIRDRLLKAARHDANE